MARVLRKREEVNGRCPPNRYCSVSRDGNAFVPERRNGSSHSLGKGLHWAGSQEPEDAPLRSTYHSVLDRNDCSTRTADYSLGGVLPVALSFIMGVQFLFFVSDVFDSRLW